MFERFTDRARRVLVLAQEEARLLNHGFIGTEHILLGLIHEGEGIAAKALESLGISLEAVREKSRRPSDPRGRPRRGRPRRGRRRSRRGRRRFSSYPFVRPCNSVTTTSAQSTCCSAWFARATVSPPRFSSASVPTCRGCAPRSSGWFPGKQASRAD